MSSASRSGNSSRTCSRVRPAARRLSTSATRIRIPRMQGRPPHCFGSLVIRSERDVAVMVEIVHRPLSADKRHASIDQTRAARSQGVAQPLTQTTRRAAGARSLRVASPRLLPAEIGVDGPDPRASSRTTRNRAAWSRRSSSTTGSFLGSSLPAAADTL